MTERIIGLASDYRRGEVIETTAENLAAPRRFVIRPYHPLPVRRPDLHIPDHVVEGFERLGSMVLARKMKSSRRISPAESLGMLRLAAIPEPWASSKLTHMIFTASADQLGKGGVIGQVSNAVNKVVAPVANVVSSVNKTVGSTMQAVAPALKVIPGIGPALSAGAQIAGSQLSFAAGSSLKSLGQDLAHPVDTLAKLTGGIAGAGAALAGAGIEGIAELPQTIATDLSAVGGYIGGMFSGSDGGGFLSGIVSAGEQFVSNVGSEAWSAIEKFNPALSGELTSIFQGLGSDYSKFATAFDSWSAQLKNQPAGSTFLGKIGNQIYTVAKDAMGHYNVTKTPTTNVSPSIAAALGEGRLAPAAGLANVLQPSRAASAGGTNAMGPGGQLMQAGQRNPAGVSLPSGPNGAAIPYDRTSLELLKRGVQEAGAAAPEPQQAGMSPWMLLGLAGVALAVLKGGVGNGPLVRAPRRRSYRRNAPRRRRR